MQQNKLTRDNDFYKTALCVVLLDLRVSNVLEKVMLYRIPEMRTSLCFIKNI